MIFWGYRGFGCESPVSEMYASCGAGGTLSILEMTNENHNCVIDADSGNSAMICAGQPDSHLSVRCEAQGFDPEALILSVTLTQDSLSCDGCIGGECANQGVALQRAFLFTLCDGDLYENNNECSGVTKRDNGNNPYCETRTGCNFGLGGGGCQAELDPVVLTATGLLRPTTAFTCIETLGMPTPEPSAAPSSMPSGEPTSAPSQAPSGPDRSVKFSSFPSMAPSVSMMPTISSEPSESPTDIMT
jgi:hypothetical protein